MKNSIKIIIAITGILFASCGGGSDSGSASKGMASVAGAENTIVGIAAQSKDHSTLVTAVETAGLVDVLATPGPFTVFAPINAAFDKLPEGTVATLLKPENKDALVDVLYYHVLTSSHKSFNDGDVFGTQVIGESVTISKKNGDTFVNGAKIIATIEASNGIIQVIDTVLLPPKKK